MLELRDLTTTAMNEVRSRCKQQLTLRSVRCSRQHYSITLVLFFFVTWTMGEYITFWQAPRFLRIDLNVLSCPSLLLCKLNLKWIAFTIGGQRIVCVSCLGRSGLCGLTWTETGVDLWRGDAKTDKYESFFFFFPPKCTLRAFRRARTEFVQTEGNWGQPSELSEIDRLIEVRRRLDLQPLLQPWLKRISHTWPASLHSELSGTDCFNYVCQSFFQPCGLSGLHRPTFRFV